MTRRALWLSALVPIVLTIGVGPARADDAVGLSLDGLDWTTKLQRPLFDPAFRWVPGDAQTRSFWVRNEGPTTASMQIALRRTDPDLLLARDEVRIDARVTSGTWTSLVDGSDQTLTEDVIGRGDRVRVDVRAVFLREAANRTERKHLPLTFVVRLTQDGSGDDDGGLSGNLPATGSAVELWIVALGTALLGTGLVLVVAARRREVGDE